LGLLGFYGFDFKSIKSFLFLILSSFVECRGFSTLNLNLLDFYLKEIYFKFLSQFLIQRFFFNIYYNLLFYIITSYIVCYCKMKLFEAENNKNFWYQHQQLFAIDIRKRQRSQRLFSVFLLNSKWILNSIHFFVFTIENIHIDLLTLLTTFLQIFGLLKASFRRSRFFIFLRFFPWFPFSPFNNMTFNDSKLFR
jgi:hypothetical protein